MGLARFSEQILQFLGIFHQIVDFFCTSYLIPNNPTAALVITFCNSDSFSLDEHRTEILSRELGGGSELLSAFVARADVKEY